MKEKNWKFKLGLGLIIFSIPLFLSLLLIPFLSLDNTTKITLTTIVFITAEVTFYTGGFFLGKELFGIDNIDETIIKLEAFFASVNSPVRLSDIGIGKDKKLEILSFLMKNKADGSVYKFQESDYGKIVDFML